MPMQGRRLPDTRFGDQPEDVRPGDYWKILDRETGEPMQSDNPQNLTGTCWHVVAPVEREWPVLGYLRNHTVREHEDGTISVRPKDGSSNSIAISDSSGEIFHGFIDHGVWGK